MSIFSNKQDIIEKVDYESKFPGDELETGQFCWKCPDGFVVINIIEKKDTQQRTINRVITDISLGYDNKWRIAMHIMGNIIRPYNSWWRELAEFDVTFETRKAAEEGIYIITDYIKRVGMHYAFSEIINSYYFLYDQKFHLPASVIQKMNTIK